MQGGYSGLLGPKKKKKPEGPWRRKRRALIKGADVIRAGGVGISPPGTAATPLAREEADLKEWGQAEAPAPPFHPSLRGLTLGSVQPLGF